MDISSFDNSNFCIQINRTSSDFSEFFVLTIRPIKKIKINLINTKPPKQSLFLNSPAELKSFRLLKSFPSPKTHSEPLREAQIHPWKEIHWTTRKP